jgi:hypothetical protein
MRHFALRYIARMSPTVFRGKDIAFSFSPEKSRRYTFMFTVAMGRRSFGWNRRLNWKNFRLSRSQIKEMEQIIEARYDELKRAWKEHLRG